MGVPTGSWMNGKNSNFFELQINLNKKIFIYVDTN
jgi:hypothetical protein